MDCQVSQTRLKIRMGASFWSALSSEAIGLGLIEAASSAYSTNASASSSEAIGLGLIEAQ